MKKTQKYLSFILGLIISFPILFQSFHAFEHHILADNIHCCDHHENDEKSNTDIDLIVDAELDLCPILEYQIVYFLSNKQVLPEQNFVLIHELKTPILKHPLIEHRDCKNKLRGPPLV